LWKLTVSIITSLQARKFGVWFPAGARDFFHPGWLWSPPSLLFNGIWGSFFRGETMYEADYSQWFTGKVTNGWSYASAPPICIHDMDKDNFTFTFVGIFVTKTFSCPTAVAHYLQSQNWKGSLIPAIMFLQCPKKKS
jgi:hypothetical protein